MSYRIVFKGQLGDEFVEDYIGKILAADWEANRLKGRVDINGNLYDASSIKAIMSGFNNPDKTDQNEANAKAIRDMWDEHRMANERLMKLSIKDRAASSSNLGLAGVMYMAVYGRRMTEEDNKHVIEKSIEWLTNHPDFSLASPSCYIQRKSLSIGNNAALSMKDALKTAAFNFAERVLVA